MPVTEATATRRGFMGGIVAASAASILAPTAFSTSAAFAAAPLSGQAQAGALRRKVGSLEVTALLDGHLDVDKALIVGYDEATAVALQRESFMDAGAARIPVNAYLINMGDKLVLVDAGTADALGPTLGRLDSALAAAGVAPGQIDAVVITHMHPDHIAGIVGADGAPVFANAELILPQVDNTFWHDDAMMNAAPDALKPFFSGARTTAAAYKGRQTLISGEAEILPGLRSLALPGHTPGHTGYTLDSEGETLFITGDVVHMAALQFARPEWGVAFDVDGAQAIATRKRVLDQIASDRVMIAGMHLPFPGFGHVARAGDGYRFVPAEWPYAY